MIEYKKISEDADAGRNALNNLKVMQSILDDPDFKTGTLENAKMKVRAVFDSLGMLNDENTLLLKEAQTFDALSNNSILPLVKMLGVNPTDRDLMFVQSAAPTLSKSKETNKLLIKSLIFFIAHAYAATAFSVSHFPPFSIAFQPVLRAPKTSSLINCWDSYSTDLRHASNTSSSVISPFSDSSNNKLKLF